MRARDLTCQLLTFAKGGVPVKETTSLVSVIRDSCDFALQGSNVLCDLFIAEDLWPVEADLGQINQVLNNMMINAKEAMAEGGIVELAAENRLLDSAENIPLHSGRYFLIAIRDHGTGIPQEHLSRIFDPCFTTKTAGNGLGLATSHSISLRLRQESTCQESPEGVQERGFCFVWKCVQQILIVRLLKEPVKHGRMPKVFS